MSICIDNSQEFLVIEQEAIELLELAEQGPRGLNGKSAYQVALENGFVGSESEWLIALGNGGTPDYSALLNKPILTYSQDFINTNVIVLNHGMQKRPAVHIQDTGGSIWYPKSITYTNLNELTVTFDSTFSGTVYLS